MKPESRQIKESPLYQGEDETIAYTLTTTPWGSSPGSISVKLYSIDGDVRTDVSSTKLSGAASALSDVITTPQVTLLEAGVKYKLEIKFTCSGNVFETWTWIYGQV